MTSHSYGYPYQPYVTIAPDCKLKAKWPGNHLRTFLETGWQTTKYIFCSLVGTPPTSFFCLVHDPSYPKRPKPQPKPPVAHGQSLEHGTQRRMADGFQAPQLQRLFKQSSWLSQWFGSTNGLAAFVLWFLIYCQFIVFFSLFQDHPLSGGLKEKQVRFPDGNCILRDWGYVKS